VIVGLLRRRGGQAAFTHPGLPGDNDHRSSFLLIVLEPGKPFQFAFAPHQGPSGGPSQRRRQRSALLASTFLSGDGSGRVGWPGAGLDQVDSLGSVHTPQVLIASIGNDRLTGQVLADQFDGGLGGDDLPSGGWVAKSGAPVERPAPPLPLHQLGLSGVDADAHR
jgi:hypothetical protein